jgi:hypothetical protein
MPPEASYTDERDDGVILRYIVGLTISAGLILLGIVWAGPTFGALGWAWTFLLAAIAVVNTLGFLRGRHT